MLYLDSAASTPLHPKVRTAMDEVREVYANPNSKHVLGLDAYDILDAALVRIARVLGVRREQLVPTYGGTDANRRVLWAMRKRFRCPSLWCSAVEHSSITDEILETNRFDPCTFEGIVGSPPFLSLMQAHNETGVCFDVATLRKKYPESLILSDWVQAAGKMPYDFKGCDFVTFSAHKIYGPKTVGVLYVKNPDQFPELVRDTHTQNIELIVGMAKAFELYDEGVLKKVSALTHRLERGIERFSCPFKILHKDQQRIAGLTSVAFENIRGSAIMSRLSEEERICVSTGSACGSDLLSVTPSMRVFESDPSYQFPLRIGLHQFLAEEEIDECIEILADMICE